MVRLCVNCQYYLAPITEFERSHCTRDYAEERSLVTGLLENRIKNEHLCFYERMPSRTFLDKLKTLIGIHPRCGNKGYYFREKTNA